jgi:hypothetical protein
VVREGWEQGGEMTQALYAHMNNKRKKKNYIKKYFWEKLLSACRKLKLDPCLSPCTCINSKWIKDLNIRPETRKLVLERSGSTLEAQ